MSEPGKDTVKVLKLYLPYEEYPEFNFVGLIIGPRGATVKNIEAESGAKVAIRGKANPVEGDDALHVQIRAYNLANVEKASVLVKKLLDGVDPAKIIEAREEWPNQNSEVSMSNSGSLSASDSKGEKINCPFYLKVGACRHGDRCTRSHTKPTKSKTIIIPNFYQPNLGDLEEFFEDVFQEVSKFGVVEDALVCSNSGDHLSGNVLVQYNSTKDAQSAMEALHGRFYGGRALTCELAHVDDFREAICRSFENETCVRGGFCNFLHPFHISEALEAKLFMTPRKYSKRTNNPAGNSSGKSSSIGSSIGNSGSLGVSGGGDRGGGAG